MGGSPKQKCRRSHPRVCPGARALGATSVSSCVWAHMPAYVCMCPWVSVLLYAHIFVSRGLGHLSLPVSARPLEASRKKTPGISLCPLPHA